MFYFFNFFNVALDDDVVSKKGKMLNNRYELVSHIADTPYSRVVSARDTKSHKSERQSIVVIKIMHLIYADVGKQVKYIFFPFSFLIFY